MYALLAILDEDTNQQIQKLYQDLKKQNLSNYAFETEGYIPHITLADFENLSLEKVIDILSTKLLVSHPIPINFSSLGSFLGTNIVFLSPVKTPSLIQLHMNIHELLADYITEDSLYRPENWVPHLTLANRIEDVKFLKLYQISHQHFSQMQSHIIGLKLIKINSQNKISSLYDYYFEPSET